MADIFISYARQDRRVAQSLADNLTGRGYSVWWDAELLGSDDFRDGERRKRRALALPAVEMKVRLSAAAEADLEHIRDTIFSESPAVAERVQRAITRAIELLKFFPHIGRPGSVKGTREKPVKSLPYIIVYTAEGGALAVLRVDHGAQNRP